MCECGCSRLEQDKRVFTCIKCGKVVLDCNCKEEIEVKTPVSHRFLEKNSNKLTNI